MQKYRIIYNLKLNLGFFFKNDAKKSFFEIFVNWDKYNNSRHYDR